MQTGVEDFNPHTHQIRLSPKMTEKEDWYIPEETSCIFRERLRELPEYKDVFNAFVKEFNANPDLTNSWLFNFADMAIFCYLKGLNQNAFGELICAFLGLPSEGGSVLWLDGIDIDTNDIELDEVHVLRRPRAQDFEYEKPAFVDHPALTLTFPQYLPRLPSAVLESKLPGMGFLEATREVSAIVMALRLFKLGSVFGLVAITRPKYLPESRQLIDPFSFPLYRYTVREEDVDKLKEFCTKLKPYLRGITIAPEIPELRFFARAYSFMSPKTCEEVIYATAPRETKFVEIAFQRFSDALFRAMSLDARLANVIIGLEALYLTSKDFGVKGKKLARRSSKLLTNFEFNSSDVFATIERAYRMRNEFIHGLSPEKYSEEVWRVLGAVLDYLRVSLVVFIQAEATVKKEKFTGLVDRASTDKTADEELRKLLNAYPVKPSR